MKTLVVFYSRTGRTKAVAEKLVEALGCDSEEITDLKNRRGLIGFFRSGYDAVSRRLTVIKPLQRNPSKYDLVIIGTPVWVGTVSAAVRTYVHMNKKFFPKKVVFFCTYGGGSEDAKKVFVEMQGLVERKPVAVLGLKADETKGDFQKKIKGFVEEIMENL